MMAEQLVEEIEKLVECSICHYPLNHPKTLGCQHSFCRHCIDELLIFNGDGSATISCPECSVVSELTPVQTTHDLTASYTFLKMLEYFKGKIRAEVQTCERDVSCKLEITCLCRECEKMYCKVCSKNHQCQNEDTLVEGYFNIYSAEFHPSCIQHKALITDICTTCDHQMICIYCKHRGHFSHQNVTLNEFANDIRDNYLEKLSTIKRHCLLKSISYKETKKDITMFRTKLELELNSVIVKKIQEYVEVLCKQKSLIIEQYENAVKEWDQFLEDHNLSHQDLVGAIEYSIEKLKRKKSFCVLGESRANLTAQTKMLSTLQCLHVSFIKTIDNEIQRSLYCNTLQKDVSDEKLTAGDIFVENGIELNEVKIHNTSVIIQDITKELTKLSFRSSSFKEPDILDFIKTNNIKELRTIALWVPSLLNNGKFIYHAVNQNNLMILKLLIDTNKNIDVDFVGETFLKYTPLFIACQKRFEKCVDVLLNNNADINKKDHNNYLALHHACMNNNVHIVKRLLHFGAQVNAVSNYNTTPLKCAINSNQEEVVKILLSHGQIEL